MCPAEVLILHGERLAAWLSGGLWAFYPVAFLVLVAEIFALLLAVAHAFRRFDLNTIPPA